jgi:hypothetical protein
MDIVDEINLIRAMAWVGVGTLIRSEAFHMTRERSYSKIRSTLSARTAGMEIQARGQCNEIFST